jgi:Holliday junction resolvase RusA-like endonuclease
MHEDLKEMYIFLFDLEAIPKGRPRLGRGRVYTPPRTANFEKKIKLEAKKQFTGDLIKGPVHMNARFFFKKAKSCKSKHMTKRCDLDNLIKSVSDALNGVVFLDDSQIISIDATKAYCTKSRIEISLYVCEE